MALSKAEAKRILSEMQSMTERIQSMTETDRIFIESETGKQDRISSLLADYNAFCEYYFPHYMTIKDKTTGEVIRKVHNAYFHHDAAEVIKNTPNLKAVFKWPRGHAKSTHMDIFMPLWLMFQPKRLINFMVIVGKSEESANRLLGDIQLELQYNSRIISDFGDQKGAASWEMGEFKTMSGVKFLAVGRGQSPRGLRERENRPDYIVIDDLDDDELCRNEDRVNKLTEWVKSTLFGSLDVGRGRFIMVGNLISKCSVLQRMCDTEGVHVSTVYATDEHGEPTWKDKWTREEVDEYRKFAGYRAFEKEMMHNPITEGGIFKYDWIRYKEMRHLQEYDELICYTDPSFRSSTKNDYKACRLWGRWFNPSTSINEFHLIDCFVRQATVGEMVRWQYDLYERTADIAPIHFTMEANFIQSIILDEFRKEGEFRGHQLPISGDHRKKGDKVQRIEAISPMWERGFVFYNEDKRNDNDMIAGISQTLALEHGSREHDDAPDADEGALFILSSHIRERACDPIIGRRSDVRRKSDW